MLRRYWPLSALLGLNLLFFHQLVLNPTHLLYSDHSDFLAEHVPAKRFLVRSFQETGELPLWNPHHFAGTPFVHDIQVAMFYPFHLALLALPEETVGPAMSWLVVLHVLLAGWLMYAYAVHRGLPATPAFIAGMGFMFGGRWLMHLLAGGHYILIGMCWLPLVLLGWERVIQRGRWAWGVLASLAYAMMVLSTQPQWTFYSGLFAGMWTLGAVLDAEHRRRALLRWLGAGAMILVFAVGMTAIQLLPTLEAAGQSSRAGGVGTAGILEEGVQVLLFLVGPPLTDEPFNLAWEARGGLGILWLVVAVWAPVLIAEKRLRYEASVCLGLFLFAMGGAYLFQWLPGFSLFRQPARMVVVATLPMAWLAARGFGVMVAGGLTEAQRAACVRWLVRVAGAVAILAGGFILRLWLSEDKLPGPHWIYFGFSVGSAFLAGSCLGRAKRCAAWLAVLLAADAVLSSGIFPATVMASDRIYPVPAYVRRVSEGRVLDLEDSDERMALGSGAPWALIGGIDAVRGYSPLDVKRYREFLAMIADEEPRLSALDSNFSYPVIAVFPVKNKRLADLLGIRHVVGPAWDRSPMTWGCKATGTSVKEYVYDFIAGGVRVHNDWRLWENGDALPRAFVVPHARPMPSPDALLDTFKNAEFRQTAYLEGFDGNPRAQNGKQGDAKILLNTPNEMRIEVDSPGFLVLSDVWFPGWTCAIDGVSAKVYRANHAFRAVELPEGAKEVVFRFEPGSYRVGRIVTFASLGLVLLAGLLLLTRRPSAAGASHPRESAPPPSPA